MADNVALRACLHRPFPERQTIALSEMEAARAAPARVTNCSQTKKKRSWRHATGRSIFPPTRKRFTQGPLTTVYCRQLCLIPPHSSSFLLGIFGKGGWISLCFPPFSIASRVTTSFFGICKTICAFSQIGPFGTQFGFYVLNSIHKFKPSVERVKIESEPSRGYGGHSHYYRLTYWLNSLSDELSERSLTSMDKLFLFNSPSS